MTEAFISANDLKAGHEAFMANESRDFFYRAATELVRLSIDGVTSLSIVEALAVLLQTWNQAYYRYNKFDEDHFRDIDKLINSHYINLLQYRDRKIENVDEQELHQVALLFEEFEEILGPVGASKCLHLMAPRFFPLWDRSIARSYGVALSTKGTNGNRYSRFMHEIKAQVLHLIEGIDIGADFLKLIDEYNYARFTKRWI